MMPLNLTMDWKSITQMRKKIISSWSLWKIGLDEYKLNPILTLSNPGLKGILQITQRFLLRQGSSLKVLKSQRYTCSQFH